MIKNDLITRNSRLLDKKYFQFLVPTLLMSIAANMSIVVDSIIVGNLLGESGLAAVNLCLPAVMSYNVISVTFGFGAATIISNAFGRRQKDYASKIFTCAIGGMVVICLLLAIGQVFLIDYIAEFLTKEYSMTTLVKEYLSYLIYGSPIIIFCYGIVFCIRADGFAKIASGLIIVSNVVNLALDVVYIRVFDMGIAGSSLATVSGCAVGLLVLIPYFLSKERNLHLNCAELLNYTTLITNCKTVIVTGVAVALNTIFVVIKIIVMNFLVQSIAGQAGVAVLAVCFSALAFLVMLIGGVTQTMSPLIGLLYGERDYPGIHFVAKTAAKMLSVCALITTYLFMIFPGAILHLFGIQDQASLELGISAVRLIALSFTGVCFTTFFIYFYVAVGRKMPALILTILESLVVLLPSAFILSQVMSLNGVWLSFTVAELASVFVVFGYFLYKNKNEPSRYRNLLLLEDNAELQAKTFEATGVNNSDNAKVVSAQLALFLREHNINPNTAEDINTSVREITSNIVRHAYPGKKGFYDLKVQPGKNEMIATFRDAGVPFDIKSQLLQNEKAATGLDIVQKSSNSIHYSRIVGYNYTKLSFELS